MQGLLSHAQGDCDDISSMYAFQSLYTTSAPSTLRVSVSVGSDGQKDNARSVFSNMQSSYNAKSVVERISNQLIQSEGLYDPKNFEFHVAEEAREVKRSSCGISDSEEEEAIEGVRHTRVSLMMDDLAAQPSIHMSLLHKSPVRQTSKPATTPSVKPATSAGSVAVPSAGSIAPPSAGSIAVPSAGSIAVPSTGSIAAPSTGTIAAPSSVSATSSAKPSVTKPTVPPPLPPSAVPSSLPKTQPTRAALLDEIRMSGVNTER